ncbi:MAG: AAA family ATPase [Muribaculaceae bacterium]|nr:AAA family ATPase [Muribaculaceae bacterium]
MNEIRLSAAVNELLEGMRLLGISMRHEFFTPEHALKILLSQENNFIMALGGVSDDKAELEKEINNILGEMEKVPEEDLESSSFSFQFLQVMDQAAANAVSAQREEVTIPHVVKQILDLEDSWASYLLRKAISSDPPHFLSLLYQLYDTGSNGETEIPDDWGADFYEDFDDYTSGSAGKWTDYVVCINDNLDRKNPLVGREKELERTIRILCRMDKNNPLHIGEPGVGKTALVYGLARMINDGEVPSRLKGAKIYGIEIGSLLAGTQYRGDFEKRLKMIMDGLEKEENIIAYIDEIHNLVGAGATSGGSMDASNMLKPYLEGGKIRFIGSTTYDEYKRYFAKSKGMVRRFSTIDVVEPSVIETIEILSRLQSRYEDFHKVTYTREAIEFAVEGSARHINDRFLPDKAIDIIDEAGAYRQTHNLETGNNVVDKDLVAEIIAKMCKVESIAVKESEGDRLLTLEDRIKDRLYGQNRAVRSVVEAVMMSKAGLSDETKPLASLLFVGPTGVGKTELAKTLADELGIGFLRFDMSEYAEKHTVAKLIGSPAGYVGYEDGGLLTDAVRKTPDCVLLLDEIEKAHSDIYNILLQVMDYASLADNKGNKADFRNVILIMTSNAGARYASQANVGFGSQVSAGSAMMNQVKKTFQPEFLNRLSDTVIFNDMDREMARMILNRKLHLLEDKLKGKSVALQMEESALEYLLSKGFSREYGAREMERAINANLKPLLMREILFGRLKDGGEAKVECKEGVLVLK